MLTVILDSNIYVSSLLVRHGIPGQVYSAWRNRRFLVVTSSEQLGEIARTLSYPRIRRRYPITDAMVELLSILRLEALIVPGIESVDEERLRDQKDKFLLAIAAESRADILVSSDQDLLVLGIFGSTRMMSPRDFRDLLDQIGPSGNLPEATSSVARSSDETPIPQPESEMGGEAPCQLHRFWDVEE